MRVFVRVGVWILIGTAAFVLFQRSGGKLDELPIPIPGIFPSDPVEVKAKGDPPWRVEGHGVRYEVISIKRGSSTWMGKTRPSITVTGYVTRTEAGRIGNLDYRFSDEAGGLALGGVPFEGDGDGNPPVGQRSRLVSVIWDTEPRAKRLTVILHAFFWPDGRNLVLRGVRVPSG